ncbi:MAG: PHB depolymerase family esterase [Caldimonas sp.]
MARRTRKTLGSSWFNAGLNAMTRTAMRAGTRAIKQALRTPAVARKRAPAKRAIAQSPVAKGAQRSIAKTASSKRGGATRSTAARAGAARKTARSRDWSSGVAIAAGGARRYRLYAPPGATRTERLPLLVMLHGCGQDADALAASSRMNRIAARERFFVLYPEQDRLSNGHGCWNWYDTRSGRAQLDAGIVDAAIDQVCLWHPVDAKRIALAGLSAGASLAALLATLHPERFCAVAMHSGIAPGIAHSSATALGAMRGRRAALPLPLAAATALPPLLAIQGSSDRIVAPSNGAAAVELWAARAGARAAKPRRVQRGSRHEATITNYRKRGTLVATLCEIAGLGHAWSGGAAGHPYSDPQGPDASRMIWSFVARAFASASAPATA